MRRCSADSPNRSFAESLRAHPYNLRDTQIHEFREKIQDPEAKIVCVFLLDGIDEMKQEYRYKNFYQTNNLEMYRGDGDPLVYPKVVYCTRAEMLVDMPEYLHMFAPLESENEGKDELDEALEYLDEFRIAPFGAKVAE